MELNFPTTMSQPITSETHLTTTSISGLNGSLQDDAAAVRASAEFQVALNYLNHSDNINASKTAGIMSHYIADIGVFAHVMAASTDWGAETGNNHANYESYVNGETANYTDEFNRYLLFDGNLSLISASDAAKSLAFDTTFDHGGNFTCAWMNSNYNAANAVYWNRAGESLNLAVNYVADVLHTLFVTANPTVSPTANGNPTLNVSLAESASALNYGNTINFTVVVEGGTNPYTYAWYIDNQSVQTGSSPYFSTNSYPVGAHHIYVQVTDAANNSATTLAPEFNVLPGTSSSPRSSPTPSPSIPETTPTTIAMLLIASTIAVIIFARKHEK